MSLPAFPLLPECGWERASLPAGYYDLALIGVGGKITPAIMPACFAPEDPSSHPAASDSEGAAESATPVPDFFIVGVGASAGGLEAISDLLKNIPAKTGLALIVVQHLDPAHASMLVELLARVTAMPVSWAVHGETVAPGHVYVAPAKSLVRVRRRVLFLSPDGRPGGAINGLFVALAEESRDRAIAIILSGTGFDGVTGLKAIKEAGGIVFAQDEASAAFPAMPRAAIDAGCVDRVLPPGLIAEELIRLMQTSRALWEQLGTHEDAAAHGGEEGDQLTLIFRLLAARTGVDFAEYKPSTIRRRLVRRMALAKASNLTEYVSLLQKSREEVELLYENLLINVTEFFRDPEFFEFLQHQILPDLLARHADHSPLRAWVPGCSTGEEVYSLAILLRELVEERGHRGQVQIFGTDVSERAISQARGGLFQPGEVGSISPERLRRFFYKTERGYMIQKTIRDTCIFARQNVIKDSPFSRLDLISCRNLLIYLGPKLHRRLIPIFYYALLPTGYLALGSSESVGSHAELFRLVDRRVRIYMKKSSSRRTDFNFGLDHVPPGASLPSPPSPVMADETAGSSDVIGEADRVLLNRFGLTGVLVNDDLEVLQFRGDVAPYLAPAEGRATLNLLKMAREGLAGELQALVAQAREQNIRVQKPGVVVMRGDVPAAIDIDVTPIVTVHPRERFYLVLFSSAEPEVPAAESPAKIKARKSVYLAQIDQLRQDLQATRNYLQATIEKHEATNQELRAANEEVQSSNEELQSTNEELETAKEELQSTNEELTTVNEELHSRQLELMQVNNDLHNLINSVHLPIIILAQDGRIRRFTPMAEKVLNVIPSDIGRPLSDININLNVANLTQLMAEVVETLGIREVEVQDHRGRWYSMRLRPYRTADNKIDGVVITLIDIDEMKRTLAEQEDARVFAQAVVESTPEPMAVLDPHLRIKIANAAFHRLFKTTSEATQERSFFEAVDKGGRLAQVRGALEGLIATGTPLVDHAVQLEVAGGEVAQVVINARQISSGERLYSLILLLLRRVI